MLGENIPLAARLKSSAWTFSPVLKSRIKLRFEDKCVFGLVTNVYLSSNHLENSRPPPTTRCLVQNLSFEVWVLWSRPCSFPQPHYTPYARQAVAVACSALWPSMADALEGSPGSWWPETIYFGPLTAQPHFPCRGRSGIRTSLLPLLSAGQVPKF